MQFFCMIRGLFIDVLTCEQRINLHFIEVVLSLLSECYACLEESSILWIMYPYHIADHANGECQLGPFCLLLSDYQLVLKKPAQKIVF